jgi:hypothetical protein
VPDAPRIAQDRVEGYFKELNNWGRWGPDDQRGTLNLLTSARRADALRLARTGRVVSLARDVVPRPVYMYHVTFPAKRERVDVVLDRFDMVYHGYWITHVDALCHVGWDGELYNGRPFIPSLSVEGASWCPIDPIAAEGITTRGVLLDIAAARKEGFVTVGHPVTPRELDETAARAGVRIQPGDAVVIRSGDEVESGGTQHHTDDPRESRLLVPRDRILDEDCLAFRVRDFAPIRRERAVGSGRRREFEGGGQLLLDLGTFRKTAESCQLDDSACCRLGAKCSASRLAINALDLVTRKILTRTEESVTVRDR